MTGLPRVLKPLGYPMKYKKRVLSFCLYGQKEIYKHGLIENIKLKNIFYPDWEFWLYVPVNYDLGFIGDLIQYINVLRVDAREDYFFTLYRFLPPMHDDVEFYEVRDLDGRLSLRDRVFVEEFIHSGKQLHIIRDHPNMTFVIGAGCYGGVGGPESKLKNIDTLIRNFKGRRDNFFVDSEFLKYVVYPLYNKTELFIHDEFYDRITPFPIKRFNGEHIGSIIDTNNRALGELTGIVKGYEDCLYSTKTEITDDEVPGYNHGYALCQQHASAGASPSAVVYRHMEFPAELL